MNLLQTICKTSPSARSNAAGHQDDLCTRVLDALLREDVRQCVSSASAVAANALPDFIATYRNLAPIWLKATHIGSGILWIPVRQAGFMQSWRSAGLPLLWQTSDRIEELDSIEDIVARFGDGLAPSETALYAAFAYECRVALAHRRVCERERLRWFDEVRERGQAKPQPWHVRLMHYDRLAAFLDHPLYPTARAKLGFDDDALRAYGPEHQQTFALRWLAVPRALYQPGIEQEYGWPAFWPSFDAVGLPPELAATHALVPVHPFVWDYHLDGFLIEASLHEQVHRAPKPYLAVVPTLSVRTLAVMQAPEWHIKLPLTIRTLGARNIRTIKASTINDGHLIQTVLGDIAASEPTISRRLILTDEERGGHVGHKPFLGYILRRYPADVLQHDTPVPVAALLAETPGGKTVVQETAAVFYGGDCEALFADYLDLTLTLHLRLWVRYGIALESNQQNTIVLFGDSALRLLLKDNDAARIHLPTLAARRPDLARIIGQLEDRRILVDETLPLAQMFTTITLQLNIAVIVERLAAILDQPAALLYVRVRSKIEKILAALAAEGDDVSLARSVLLDADHLYIKYLLIAATLAEKAVTGAADVNKFYGRSAPNFLRAP